MNEREKQGVATRVRVALGRRDGESVAEAARRAKVRARGEPDQATKILARRVAHAQAHIDAGNERGWDRLKKALDDADAGLGRRPGAQRVIRRPTDEED